MKRKQIFLAIAVLLAAGGLWLARSAWRSDQATSQPLSVDVDVTMPHDGQEPGGMHQPGARPAPPNPTRRFKDFTPEQRVEFARRGHGPGG